MSETNTGPARRDETASGPPAGRRLGQYVLEAPLGSGGMGTVFRALHVRLKKWVALKVIREGYGSDPGALARFQREMELIGSLDHPNVVRALDANEDGGCHFLVMEYVDGPDLSRVTARLGPWRVADAAAAVRQAALGLQCAHERGLVHRDVKPSNLLLAPEGTVKVVDLGVARFQADGPRDPAAEPGRLTGTGQMIGTPDYIAPEQALDGHRADIRSDLYSLGCTLYHLLAGRPPFSDKEHDSHTAKVIAHVQTPPPEIRSRRADVPEALAAVVRRLLAKDPAQRYATPELLALALEPFAAGSELAKLHAEYRRVASDGTPPDAETRAYHSQTFAPATVTRRRRRALAALVVLLSLGIGAAVWLARPVDSRPPVDPPADPPEVLVPGRWYNLLNRPPRKLYWPVEAADPAFDAARETLSVNGNHLGLLRLGTVTKPGYVIRMKVRQNGGWTGRFGVFFGYRTRTDGEGRTVAAFQYVELRPGGPAGNAPLRLIRAKSTLTREANGQMTEFFRNLRCADLHDSEPVEHILRVEVGAEGGLIGVQWGNDRASDLTTEAANAFFRPEDYVGDFGLYMKGTSAEIREAQAMIFTEDAP